MINALIVDDEPPARNRLQRLLAGIDDVAVVGECENGDHAVASIEELRPDLVFLDVQMPGLDGFDVLNRTCEVHQPAVIFTTAYDEHALRAFEVHALDFLLKPFDAERLTTALDRARTSLIGNPSELYKRLTRLLESRPNNRNGESLARIAVSKNDRTVILKTDRIDWMESAGNYVRLHVNGEEHSVRSTLSGLAGRLDQNRFARIHRSIVVNMDRVQEIAPWFHGDYAVILKDGTRLSLSRTYKKSFEQMIGVTKATP